MIRINFLAVATCVVALVRALGTWQECRISGGGIHTSASVSLDVLLIVLAIGCAAACLSMRQEARSRTRANEALCQRLADRYGFEVRDDQESPAALGIGAFARKA